MTTIMPLELSCPNCKTSFETRMLGSAILVGAHTDFRQSMRGESFEVSEFAVHSCPKCGFSGPREWFKRKLSEKLRKLVATTLSPLTEGGHTSPWRKFEHAAQIAQWTSRPSEEIADFYLKAAYLCAHRGHVEEERSNRAKAIEFFRRSIEEGTLAKRNVPTVTYLVGELYRRIGLADDANIWLEKAETLAGGRSNLASLAKLARQQRTDPQDMIGFDHRGIFPLS